MRDRLLEGECTAMVLSLPLFSVRRLKTRMNVHCKTKGIRSRWRKYYIVLVFVATFFIVFMFHNYDEEVRLKWMSNWSPIQTFSTWPVYKPDMDHLNQDCFENQLVRTLASLEDNLKLWAASKNPFCRNLYDKFSNIYRLKHHVGEVKIPSDFYPKLANWLNNKQDLLQDVKHQYILHIYNEYMREHAVFSPLRANRPQSSSGTNPYEYAKKIILESAVQCDFCNYLKHTSEDIFGRIKTNRSVSAANTFKVDRWHSLIIPLKHSLLDLDEDDVIDMFEAAEAWLAKVHSLEPIYKYPWLMWDIMPHAGASQVHPHVHVGLTPDYYVGIYENMRRGAELYYQRYKANFFQDLVEIHAALGLAVTSGETTAFAQITSRKDTEVTVISRRPNKDFYRFIYYIYKAFMDIGFYDFSSLTVHPIMGSSGTEGSLPAIIRISSRGNVADIKSEISSFELYQFANLNFDPYKIIQHVNSSLNTRRKASRP